MQDDVSEYPVPPDQDDPRFRRFFDYWTAKKGGRVLPCKADFDPLDHLDLLGLVNIVRVERGEAGLRFLITLWGTGVTFIYDGDYGGRYVDEVFEETRLGTVHASYEEIVQDQKPHFWKIEVAKEGRGFLSYRRLALPFGDAAGEVSDIIMLILPDEVD